jgi:signal transduction histidine kinase
MLIGMRIRLYLVLPRIKKTTVIGFALIILIFVLIGIVTWIEIHSLSRLTSIIYRHPLEVSNAALRASMSVVKMHRSMKDVVLADEQLQIEEAINSVIVEEEIVYQNLDIIQNKILGDEGQALIRETIVFFMDWQPIREEVINLVRKGARLKAAAITKGKGAQHELLLENKMLELTAYARKKADGFIGESINVHQRVSYLTIIIVSAGTLLSLAIAFLTTRQIMSAFLLQKEAEKALQESSEKIKLFAYSVAHDLKSPAIALHGLTGLLCKNHMDSLTGKGKHLCGQIQRSAKRIVRLADMINVFVSTKQTPLNIEKVSLKEILQIIREEFSTQMNIRSIEWIESENLPDTILADRVSVLRVLRNLVDNALKYAGDTFSRIEIGYKQSNNFHIISVADDGKGIKNDDFNKVFVLFQQQASSQEVHGTGLGLAIVKEIVELHKGDAWVEPNPYGGITFYVSISMHLK